MAGPGTYGAYQQLRPLEADFAGVVKEQEAAMRRDLEQKKAQAAARKARKQQLVKDFAEDYSTLTEVITGNKTIDASFARGINQARNLMGELYEAEMKDPLLADDVGHALMKENLSKFSSNLATISERYTQYNKQLAEGMAKGELSNWNTKALNDADSVFVQKNLAVTPDMETGLPRGLIMEVDDNGNPVLDEDGEPVLKDMDLVNILDGSGMPQAVAMYDFDEKVADLGSNIGKKEITTANGDFSHYTYQQWKDVEPKVRGMVKGFLGTVDRPTAAAKSIWADAMGRAPKNLTEEDMKEIEDYYVESTSVYYDEISKQKKDYGAEERANKSAKEEAEEMDTGLEMATYDEGGAMKIGRAQIGPEFGGNAYVFTPREAVEFTNSKGQKVIATRVFLGEDEKVYYEGVIKGGQASTKDYDEQSMSESTIRKQIFDPTLGGEFTGDGDLFARALPGKVKNLDDLRRRLIEKKNQFKLDNTKQQLSDEEAAAKADELLKKYAG